MSCHHKSVFSTPFFEIEKNPGGGSGDLVVSSQLWILWLIAVPLSLLLLAWAWWAERSVWALGSTPSPEKDAL